MKPNHQEPECRVADHFQNKKKIAASPSIPVSLQISRVRRGRQGHKKKLLSHGTPRDIPSFPPAASCYLAADIKSEASRLAHPQGQVHRSSSKSIPRNLSVFLHLRSPTRQDPEPEAAVRQQARIKLKEMEAAAGSVRRQGRGSAASGQPDLATASAPVAPSSSSCSPPAPPPAPGGW